MICKIDYLHGGTVQLKIMLKHCVIKQNNVFEKKKWFDIVQAVRLFHFSLQELTSLLDYRSEKFSIR